MDISARHSTFGYDFDKQYYKPKAKANIRAASLVEINYIYMNDFLEIMECYPKFFERFKMEYRHTYDINDPDEVRKYFIAKFLCVERNTVNYPFNLLVKKERSIPLVVDF